MFYLEVHGFTFVFVLFSTDNLSCAFGGCAILLWTAPQSAQRPSRPRVFNGSPSAHGLLTELTRRGTPDRIGPLYGDSTGSTRCSRLG